MCTPSQEPSAPSPVPSICMATPSAAVSAVAGVSSAGASPAGVSSAAVSLAALEVLPPALPEAAGAEKKAA